MCLLDTIDGAFMNFAYGWAFSRPVRKAFYNITVTALSVAVALLIGGIELLSVLARKLDLRGGLWDVVSGLDLNLVGYVIVGLFVVTWALALAIWRLGHIEERWSERLEHGLDAEVTSRSRSA
jgi:high-affinity nickel-transport protein